MSCHPGVPWLLRLWNFPTELFEKSFRADPVKTTVNRGVFVGLVGKIDLGSATISWEMIFYMLHSWYHDRSWCFPLILILMGKADLFWRIYMHWWTVVWIKSHHPIPRALKFSDGSEHVPLPQDKIQVGLKICTNASSKFTILKFYHQNSSYSPTTPRLVEKLWNHPCHWFRVVPY